ncbi:Pfs, NACHT and ankyrin domain protein [Aspergillus tamarii]|uniref:Pfs, NACHT and ankyrin domain protein n=1 Tax=Aspergillus tamarii TaxID=41984 RepID=A0A5N6UE63_ASPTM|nr:Pfs, NACHT and ankyrin domain protein [Aspergillus tamarii]
MPPLKALESRDLYTVGWIAALPLERAAAMAMLDEKHERPVDFVQPHSDTNSYTWGSIGEHNVVIASLAVGKYGTTSAAATALPMLASFPQIRFGLLVGIGAAIARPDEGRDIRLGDVVVSQPHGNTGGVIQYDLFKAKPRNHPEDVAFLNSPPEVLLHALGNLQAQHELEPPKLLHYLEEMIARYPRLARQGYLHRGFENDQLFQTSDSSKEIERSHRDSTDPEIHYGIIASGNTLFRDATYRDSILKDIEDKCICLEMEAAGLMNNFPCIVIRGICDYADSHKSDLWQRYASATAAAYAKELLTYVPCQDLQKAQTAMNILEDISETVADTHAIAQSTSTVLRDLRADNQFSKIESWLSPPDPSTNFNEAQKRRQEGTGLWLFEIGPFKEWMSGTRQHLWLHGLSGCGKTILSATIIEHLNQQLDSSHIVLYFFFDFNDSNKQTLGNLLTSLTMQLYSKCKNSRVPLESLLLLCENGRQKPSHGALCDTFMQMVGQVKNLQIVIDALDECTTKEDLLLWMERVASSGHTGLQLLITSQKREDIEDELKRWIQEDNFLPIQQDAISRDIRLYICERLRNDHHFRRWRSQPFIRNEIETELMDKANGMFRWVACQLDRLQKCLLPAMVREALNSLPGTLQETYARILANIDEIYRPYAIRILQFLTYSERPLTIEEAVDIIVVNPGEEPSFDSNERMPEPREIAVVCSSLVCLVTRRDRRGKTVMELQLAHFSVQQYLESTHIAATFPKKMTDVACITKVCLAYLSHLDEESVIEDIGAEYPLVPYCVLYWVYHAKFVETECDVQQSILDFFLQQRLGYEIWIRLSDDRALGRKTATIGAPLYYASLAGLQHTVQLLLDKGAKINERGGGHGSALQAACVGGHREVVQVLLQNGADVNIQDDFLGNALQNASSMGHEEIVQLLLENGANADTQGGIYGTGPYGDALQIAAARGNKEVVQLLLENGADVKTIIQLLSKRKVKVVLQNRNKYDSALQAAAAEGHMEIVQLLREKEADAQGDAK